MARQKSNQLSLLGLNAPRLDPKAPRAERMGAVEAQHWRPRPASGSLWSVEGHRWVDVQGGALPVLVGVDEAGRGPLAGPVSVAAVIFDPGTLFCAENAKWVGWLDDSKKISHGRRQKLFGLITTHAAAWSIVHMHADHIDRANILQATYDGMSMAVEEVLGWSGQAVQWPGRPAALRQAPFEGGQTPEQCWYSALVDAQNPPLGADRITATGWSEALTSALVLVDGHKPFKVAQSSAARLTQQPVVKGDALSFHIAAASILAKVSRDAIMAHLDGIWPEYGFAGHKGYPTVPHRTAVHTHGHSPVHRKSFKVTPP